MSRSPRPSRNEKSRSTRDIVAPSISASGIDVSVARDIDELTSSARRLFVDGASAIPTLLTPANLQQNDSALANVLPSYDAHYTVDRIATSMVLLDIELPEKTKQQLLHQKWMVVPIQRFLKGAGDLRGWPMNDKLWNGLAKWDPLAAELDSIFSENHPGPSTHSAPAETRGKDRVRFEDMDLTTSEPIERRVENVLRTVQRWTLETGDTSVIRQLAAIVNNLSAKSTLQPAQLGDKKSSDNSSNLQVYWNEPSSSSGSGSESRNDNNCKHPIELEGDGNLGRLRIKETNKTSPKRTKLRCPFFF